MKRAAVMLVLAAAAAPAGELRTAERDVARVLEKVGPTVVTVLTPDQRDLDLTGVVVSRGGAILTIRGPLLDGGALPAQVRIVIPGKEGTHEADVVAEDPQRNTVLLKAHAAKGRALDGTSPEALRLGGWALLVANTFGAGRETKPTASLGVVSGVVGADRRRLTVSALANPGSVGAPVVDLDGNVLGIVGPERSQAGEQTVVFAFHALRAAYRDQGGDAAREFAARLASPRPVPSLADAFGLVIGDAARRGAPVLVGIRAERGSDDKDPPPPPPPDPSGKRKRPSGPPPSRRVAGALAAWDRCSGTIVAADGWILCPLRITGWPGAPRALVVDLPGGRRLAARIAGTDERLRVALLKVEASGLPVLEPAARETVRAGRFAIALGFPHEAPDHATPQVTVGIVSRVGALKRLHPMHRALQTDAGVSGGNRGGPLVDIDGRLLGVVLDGDDTDLRGYHGRHAASHAWNSGLGFAVPWDQIEELLPRLRRGERLRPVRLGVGVAPVEGGLRILEVAAKREDGSPTAAQAAGLKVGDVLVAIDGTALAKNGDLTRELARRHVGDEVEFTILRDGTKQKLRAVLTAP